MTTVETIPGHGTRTADILADAQERTDPAHTAGRLAVWDGLLGLPEPTTGEDIAAHQRATRVLHATLRDLPDDATTDEVYAVAIAIASEPGTLDEVLHALGGVSVTAKHGEDPAAIRRRNRLIRQARKLGATYETLGARTHLSRTMLNRIIKRGT